MKKEFLKIAGVKSEKAFYEKYPTEEAFFAAHPKAIKELAKGGTPEAYPQIATFDNAFRYGVPPGPQYLAGGGSAFPQAQTEAQFFVPIYTDVANPYNMAYGGSNLEMYPNANVPRVGPTNIFFQEGGASNPMLEQVVQLLQQGVDPQVVVQQLIKAGISQDDAIQTVQAVVNEMQQAGQQQQEQPMPDQGQQAPPQEAPMMQGGGQEQNIQIGVGNRLGSFMNKVSSMAANAQNKRLGTIAGGMMKNGGGLRKFQSTGQYNSVDDYIKANSISDDPYLQAQLQNDPKALESYLSNAYKDYYGLYSDAPSGSGTGRSYDPNADVYKNDPVYKSLLAAYGPGSGSSTTTNTNTNTKDPNKRLSVDMNDLANLLTPGGRIKSKSMIDGVRGRGRSNEYMWQTLFNTDNFAEAQRLAAETGLKIDEGRAGLLGRRKKYSYEWGQGPMPGTQGASGTPGGGSGSSGTTPGGASPAGPNSAQPPSGTIPGQQKPGAPDDMGFFARMFYKPGNVTGQGRGAAPGTPSDPNALLSPQMTSAFDSRGYNPNYSEARNQIFQNRRQRIGEKLDNIYQKRADLDDMGLNLSDKDTRRMNRLGNRFNRTGTGKGVNYSFNTYEEPTPAPGYAYGGIPKASFGLFNKTAGNELTEKGPDGGSGTNKFTEKETSGFADDYLKGMANFERNQATKIGLTNFMNSPDIQQGMFGASDPMQRLYANMESVYPERGIGRGNSAFTFNPLNMDTQPYKNGPAYFDNFAAKSLAPSFNARQGGSINQGDIRYMTDEEIAEFVANGGQVEYLD